MIVEKRFHLPLSIIKEVQEKFKPSFGFGGFGEITYYRTYSRSVDVLKGEYRNGEMAVPFHESNKNETWLDSCIRVVEGTFSIRKDWYYKIGLKWEETKWQAVARQMLEFIYQMKFLPPGRGLFSMGSDHVYKIGSMALNNCANVNIRVDSLADDLAWSMDALMCGCGVGYKLDLKGSLRVKPLGLSILSLTKNIPDTREGWVESTEFLIESLVEGHDVEYNYDLIREFGQPIKGFGGVASGPAPLMILHSRIRHYFKLFRERAINPTHIQLHNHT